MSPEVVAMQRILQVRSNGNLNENRIMVISKEAEFLRGCNPWNVFGCGRERIQDHPEFSSVGTR